MKYNVEEQAKINYNNLFNIIECLLKKEKFLTMYDLKNHYAKLKRKERLVEGMSTLPLIGKMIYNNQIHSSLNSESILKLAQFMKKCKIHYIDSEILEYLKTNKNHYYYLYFKEDYENEIIALNYKCDAYDCLFENN